MVGIDLEESGDLDPIIKAFDQTETIFGIPGHFLGSVKVGHNWDDMKEQS